MKSFHLIIDSKGAKEPSDFIFYLDDKLPSDLTRVAIKSISILQPGHIANPDYVCYIHTDMLNKDDNYLNTQKTDILALFPVNHSYQRKYVFHKFSNTFKKLKSADINSIRLTLTDQKNKILSGMIQHIIYEIEFN